MTVNIQGKDTENLEDSIISLGWQKPGLYDREGVHFVRGSSERRKGGRILTLAVLKVERS